MQIVERYPVSFQNTPQVFFSIGALLVDVAEDLESAVFDYDRLVAKLNGDRVSEFHLFGLRLCLFVRFDIGRRQSLARQARHLNREILDLRGRQTHASMRSEVFRSL